MTQNPYAIKSKDIDFKLKQKLIDQSKLIQENASLYLELESIPLDGNGKIVKTFNNKKSHPKNIYFSNFDSVKASIKSSNQVGVLISCSHRRAGGGWLSGSLAQEESVSRTSTWAIQAALPKFSSWYTQDKNTHWLGQKGALIIDGLFLFDNKHKELPETKRVVFAGVAAANKGALKNDIYWESEKGIQQRQEFLIENLACAIEELYKRGVSEVVLCAFGTNVFGWKFEESIKVLYEAAKFSPNSLKLTCAVCSIEKAALAKTIYENLMQQDLTENKSKRAKP
jgi:uncharacterized protein (TIGR02452 family)